ncbi:hypothetical protein BN2476_850046 [Paraburkholderia piptadeniae]|uniref:Uncharacterized protein n=1 Tax=Paraburkholderia piptadeniae TaxID=1701573 RepID=A0A1N7ST97_9BURK|nr:hypothetical protein BN2476_850046 [Paraburkholderia piptadeniae]
MLVKDSTLIARQKARCHAVKIRARAHDARFTHTHEMLGTTLGVALDRRSNPRNEVHHFKLEVCGPRTHTQAG